MNPRAQRRGNEPPALHPGARRAQDVAMAVPRFLLPTLLRPLAAAHAGAQDGDITIYRCTDAAGHLTVQDSPCADDQSQQVRRMIQPDDPPPRAEPREPATPPPAAQPQPIVVMHAPRPMYECIRDDGSRYTSDDGEGNPRWVSTGWLYYDGPVRRPGAGFVHAGAQAASTAPAATAQGDAAAGG